MEISELTLSGKILAIVLTCLLIYKTILKIKDRKNPPIPDNIIAGSVYLKSLTKHTLFASLKRIRATIKNRLDMGSEVKTKIFRDIMMHKIDTWGNKLLYQAERVDKACNPDCTGSCRISIADLIRYNDNLLEEGMESYGNYFVNNPDYTEEEKEVLKYSMASFNNQNLIAVGMISEIIKSVLYNSKYGYCAKAYQSDIFTAYEIGMKLMLSQSVKALEQTNGFYIDKKFGDKTYSDEPEWVIKLRR